MKKKSKGEYNRLYKTNENINATTGFADLGNVPDAITINAVIAAVFQSSSALPRPDLTLHSSIWQATFTSSLIS